MKPLIMAHRGGDCFGKENSLLAIKKSLEYKPDIIELDVRKSKDGILFCYHGNAIEYFFPNYFFKHRTFSKLKKKYSELATLKDAVSLVGNQSILFLDIQDRSIELPELTDVCSDTNFKEVWIAARDFEFYERAGDLPKGWKKVYNGLFKLSGNIDRIVDAGLDVVELMYWDFKDKNIRLLKEKNIDIALVPYGIPNWFYIKKCISKQAVWIMIYKFYELRK